MDMNNNPITTTDRTTFLPSFRNISKLSFLFYSANVSALILSFIAVKPLLVSLSFTRVDLFSWHPICMMLAFISLINAVMIYHSASPETRYITSMNHAKRQIVSLIILSFGFCCIFINKIKKSKLHFTSTHGQLGFALFFTTWLVGLFGSIFKFFPGMVGGRSVTRILFVGHRMAGYFVLFGVAFEIYSGLQSHWAKNHLSETEIFICNLCLIITMLSVSLRREWTTIFHPTTVPVQLP